MHHLVETVTGPLVVLLTVSAVVAFVAADLIAATRRDPSSRQLARRCLTVAWPLSLATLAVVILRVAVLS